MTAPARTGAPDYPLRRRELVAQTAGLRVQILTLAAGQCVPWHHHSAITDTFFCMDGPMRIQTRGAPGDMLLQAGESAAVPPGIAHRVAGLDDGPCRFMIVQGVGTYDFVPDADGPA